MISEFFVDLFVNVVQWAAGLMPDGSILEQLESPESALQSVLDMAEGVGVWVPWGVLGTCAAIAVGVYAAGLGITLWRVILSHLPFVGGH